MQVCTEIWSSISRMQLPIKKIEYGIWNTQVYLGGGLMYNAYHGLVSPLGKLEYPDGRLQPIINVGMSNLFRVSPRVQLGFDVGGICGWGLYQDSCDMIPSAFLRAVYSFPM